MSEGPKGSTLRIPLKLWSLLSSTSSSIVKVARGSEVGAVLKRNTVEEDQDGRVTETGVPSTRNSQFMLSGRLVWFITVSKVSSNAIPGGSVSQPPEKNPGLSGNTALGPKGIGQSSVFLRNPGSDNNDLASRNRERNRD